MPADIESAERLARQIYDCQFRCGDDTGWVRPLDSPDLFATRVAKLIQARDAAIIERCAAVLEASATVTARRAQGMTDGSTARGVTMIGAMNTAGCASLVRSLAEEPSK